MSLDGKLQPLVLSIVVAITIVIADISAATEAGGPSPANGDNPLTRIGNLFESTFVRLSECFSRRTGVDNPDNNHHLGIFDRGTT